MSLWEILDTLFLKPLHLLFEMIYMMTNKGIDNPGLSIVVLSLAINFLILPLYKRADALQEEERDMEAKLHKGVAHIKKTFRGDERMMMLQTYYRQNNYKPTYVLRGALSLFLEIPFFIAAYRFLSALKLLEGVPFGPITDLGQPDGMLLIGGVSVNLLPILMTAVNLVSCVIFTKGSTLKSKIQLYAMAVFFLFFLYSSPAGLVFYWTLNNIFSLIKTIFYKLKNPGKVLGVLFSAAGVGILILGLWHYGSALSLKKRVFLTGISLILQIPLIYSCLKNKIHLNIKRGARAADKKIFFAGAIFLSVLTGLLIPSAVIKASPQEFMDINYFYHPLWFVASSFCLALGAFVVWGGVFYWLTKPAVRIYFDWTFWVLSGMALVNYMIFGKNLGLLTPQLKYERGVDFSAGEQLGNLIVLMVVAVLLSVVYLHWKKHIPELLVIAVLAFTVMFGMNVSAINASIKNISEQITAGKGADNEMSKFTLSRTGKNVIVLMLDRSAGRHIPYIFNEKPELKEQFSGFTHYSNVITFGAYTNMGSPALFGGYEYTPLEMNKRKEEELVSKQNEALKVMPLLFSQNGYDVTVCDPTYANYQIVPDLSIYDEYPDIQALITRGKFADSLTKEQRIQSNTRNFFCYGLMRSIPLCIWNLVYGYGDYNQGGAATAAAEQVVTGMYTAEGISAGFMDAYSVLTHLPYITGASDSGKGTFLILTNDTAHDVMMLQEPEYVPAQYVDNTEFEAENRDRFTLDGNTLNLNRESQFIDYQCNMAAMIQLGKWFDYLREIGVYDNTRIILVSDHGTSLGDADDSLVLEDGTNLCRFYPLLMVKDFDSRGFKTSEEFMTNADVPALAVEDIIDEPINPFTGKVLDSSEKTAHAQYVLVSGEADAKTNSGTTFLPGTWYSVHGNIWDKTNWRKEAEDAVLPITD